MSLLQLDPATEIGTFGIVAGVIFFLVLAAVAYIVFRMMRKTVKWAIRVTVVTVILLVALIGGIAVYWNSSSKQSRPKPTPARTR